MLTPIVDCVFYFHNIWERGHNNKILLRPPIWPAAALTGSEKEKISSERQLCGRKCLVDVRGQRRMGRLVGDDRKATVTQINTRYNQDMQNTIS